MDTLILHDIYSTLKSFGDVKSQNHFSRDMLGRSSRLYSLVLATDNSPALDVMLGLYARLDDMCELAKKAENISKAKQLDDLTTRLWQEIRTESLLRGPFKRSKRRVIDAHHGT